MNKKASQGRGNWLQMHYDPDFDSSVMETVQIEENFLDNRVGLEDCVILNIQNENKARNFHLKDKTFTKCDIKASFKRSSFTRCTFIRCDFSGSNWEEVKFSDCSFRYCDFTQSTFKICIFLSSCSFEKNSTSAEHFVIEKTAIDATAFINSLGTNLEYLSDSERVKGIDKIEDKKKYQISRLVITKGKIAKKLYNSNSDQAELDLIYVAHKELILGTLRRRIEEKRYKENNDIKKIVEIYSLKFYFNSIPDRIELGIVKLSGAITDWGRSLGRAVLFFLAIILIFMLVYWIRDGISIKNLFKAIDVTLVAGYSSYIQPEQGNNWDRLILLLNLLSGLFWYVLIFDVLTKKVHR